MQRQDFNPGEICSFCFRSQNLSVVCGSAKHAQRNSFLLETPFLEKSLTFLD